jgi:hypothetical protein
MNYFILFLKHKNFTISILSLLALSFIPDFSLLVTGNKYLILPLYDSLHSRFEESILYAPLISNLENVINQKNFTGLVEGGAFTPMPILTQAIFKVFNIITNGDPYISILLLHLLISIQYFVTYKLISELTKNIIDDKNLISIFTLISVLSICFNPLLSRKSEIIILIFSFMLSLVISKCTSQKNYIISLCIFVLMAIIGYAGLKYFNILINNDSHLIRIPSPIFSMIFLNTSLWLLIKIINQISLKRVQIKLFFFLSLIISANLYIYYLNILILLPILFYLFLLLLINKRYILILIFLSLLVLFSMPYGYINFHNISSSDFKDFFERVSAIGTLEYRDMNYPSKFMIAPGLFYICLYFGILLFNRKKISIIKSSVTIVGIILITIILILVSNYFTSRVLVPQASLVIRFFPQFLVIASIFLLYLVKDKFNICFNSTNILFRAFFFALIGYLGFSTFTRFQLSFVPKNGEMQKLENHMNFIKHYFHKKEDVLISDIQAINIYSPVSMNIKTLYSNPFTSIVSNNKLLLEYHAAYYLLNLRDENIFFKNFIRDFDTFDEPHYSNYNYINNLEQKVRIYSQGILNIGTSHSYAIPSKWINENKLSILKQLNKSPNFEFIFNKYKSVLLYVNRSFIPPFDKRLKYTLLSFYKNQKLYRITYIE